MLYKDYRDFVFKNSKYIGELNEMYIQSSEIPWHQDKTSFSLATELDIIILKRFMQDLGNDEKNIRLLDIGCGLGYLTNRLKHELTDYTSIEIVAVDVSDNVIKKAKHEFKGIEFISLDMSHKLSKELGNFDIIFIKNILWYIIDNRKTFFENVRSLMTKDSFVFFVNSIPGLEQFYGKKVFPDANSIIDYLNSQYFVPIYNQISSEAYFCDDPTVVKNTYDRSILLRYIGRL